ncbi:MAG: YiiD C-terminal domain-containing protein [Candidatus Thiodiazotropha sp. L084R]
MDILTIPFIKKVGIEMNADGALTLPFNNLVVNHIQTIHASALHTLAEAASGEMLKHLFPSLVGKVVPVVRDSQIKYKHPATKPITAYPNVSEEAIEKFTVQLGKRGRSSISIDVEIKDSENITICSGSFSWFVQSLEKNT